MRMTKIKNNQMRSQKLKTAGFYTLLVILPLTRVLSTKLLKMITITMLDTIDGKNSTTLKKSDMGSFLKI